MVSTQQKRNSPRGPARNVNRLFATGVPALVVSVLVLNSMFGAIFCTQV